MCLAAENMQSSDLKSSSNQIFGIFGVIILDSMEVKWYVAAGSCRQLLVALVAEESRAGLWKERTGLSFDTIVTFGRWSWIVGLQERHPMHAAADFPYMQCSSYRASSCVLRRLQGSSLTLLSADHC